MNDIPKDNSEIKDPEIPPKNKVLRGSVHNPPTNGFNSTTNRAKGRIKGSKNKFTSLKQAFYDVFNKLGGVDKMLTWVQEDSDNEKFFYQMLSKMLPREVSVTGSIEENVKAIKVEIINGKDRDKDRDHGSKGD